MERRENTVLAIFSNSAIHAVAKPRFTWPLNSTTFTNDFETEEVGCPAIWTSGKGSVLDIDI